MIDGQIDRLDQFLVPRFDRLTGTGIDEVEGHAREDLARQPDGGQRLFDIMEAAEEFQILVVQRLDAHGDAVDTGGAITTETLGLDARWVGFQGDLDARRHMPCIGNAVQDRLDGRRLHQRGRAAADEDGGDGAWAGELARGGHLFQESLDKARLVDRLMAHMAVEVAIGAFGRAEGPMQIDAEAGIARIGENLAVSV